MISAYGSELGRSRSNLIWLNLISACGSELGRSVLVDRSCGDWCLPDRSCGSMLVAEMVWIRPRGRVDLEMGIEMEKIEKVAFSV